VEHHFAYCSHYVTGDGFMPEQIPIPSIDLAVIAQLIIVFGWAALLLLIDFFVPDDNKQVTGWLACLGVIGALGAGFLAWGTSTTTFSGMIRLDNFAIAFNTIFLIIALLSIIISLDYLKRQDLQRGEYFSMILFATGGMMLLAQGASLVVLFIGLELLSICLYILVGYGYQKMASEEAALKYLVVGAFGAGFLVFGIALVYGATGKVLLADIAAAVPTLDGENRLLALVGLGLLLVGFGYKIAMAPFHMWSPDVYEGAPTPVTAFMSTGAKAAGFAAIAQILTISFANEAATWVPILSILAGLTMLVGNITALAQTNVKRMLAYSSIGHAGYLLMGVIAMSDRGIESLVLYLLAYAFTNIGAFAVLISLERHGESAWTLDDLTGLWSRRPLLAVAMGICLLSLAGVPPTIGFVAKFDIFSAAWQSGHIGLVVVAVISSGIAAFFYLRVIAKMFLDKPIRDIPIAEQRNLWIGLGIAVAAVVIFGILPTPLIDFASQSILALGQ
jgi:NADH-quinone oxidoreductase subunit N